MLHIIAVIGMRLQTCGELHRECRRVTQETAARGIQYADLMNEVDANSDYIENGARTAEGRERLPAPHGNSGFKIA